MSGIIPTDEKKKNTRVISNDLLDSNKQMNTRQKIYFELSAVCATALGKFIFMDLLNLKLVFICSAIMFWFSYVLFCSLKQKESLVNWGFRKDNLHQVIRKVLPFVLFAVTSSFLVGYVLGTLHLTWHIFPILLVYPLWGIVQQFLVLGLVTHNLSRFTFWQKRPQYNVIASAFMFSLIHLPHLWLAMGTFILALFYSHVYLKSKNIFVMGVLHGWLGALFFYTVVDRDPYVEIFSTLLH